MIEVTHYWIDNFEELSKIVDINPHLIIAIEDMTESFFKNGEWHKKPSKFRKVICRDNLHYKVSIKDAAKLKKAK